MAGQVGWKTESTWGTGVTVDTFMPVVKWGITVDEGLMRPKGIRAGRRTSNPGLLGKRTVSGSLEMELPNASIASMFKHLFGAVATTGAGPYTHTFTPGAHLAKSQTLQGGVEGSAGTIHPFTATGVKHSDWEIGCKVGEFAMLKTSWTAKDITTATGLATASYTAGLAPFTFVQGSITVNGSAVATCNSATFACKKGLRDDRFVLGSRYINEQLEEERFEFTTEMDADFVDLTLYNLAVASTQVASVLTFTNGTDSLVITCSGQVIGDPPELSKIGLESQTIKMEHSHASSDASAVTAVLINSEASAA